jgi:hypothetical protein
MRFAQRIEVFAIEKFVAQTGSESLDVRDPLASQRPPWAVERDHAGIYRLKRARVRR